MQYKYLKVSYCGYNCLFYSILGVIEMEKNPICVCVLGFFKKN